MWMDETTITFSNIMFSVPTNSSSLISHPLLTIVCRVDRDIHHCALVVPQFRVLQEVGYGGLGFKELGVRGAMFATAVLWARKSGLRPGNVSSVGEQVESASQALYKILEQHGPITASDCWKHASTMENHALKSKQHLKLMLRWMREKHRVNIVCQHKGDKKSSNPNDRQFLFSIAPPKVLAEPTEPDYPLSGV